MAFSDTKVRAVKPDEKAYILTDGDGLFLHIHPNGSKYWRFRFGGKQHLMAFGVYPEISLADARERRDVARKLIANGFDPSEKRKDLKKISKRNLIHSRKSLSFSHDLCLSSRRTREYRNG